MDELGSIASIRRFVRERRQVERCELCGKEVPPRHEHLMEPPSRKILCACDACAMLFDGAADARFQRIPHRIERLNEFEMTETQWLALNLPINLAFFYFSTPANKILAMFPSPAGATESALPLSAWDELLSAANPVLASLQRDTEALLVNRVSREHECWRVPIDECFKLVGVIRTHWRGLSGGTQVWREIDSFYDSLRERASGTTPAAAGGGHG